jgi:hypothetical protein
MSMSNILLGLRFQLSTYKKTWRCDEKGIKIEMKLHKD